MATFTSDTLGGLDDRVRLELGTDEVLIAESYEIHAGILTQPAAFSIRVGWGGTAKDLITRYIPGTPFRLRIGNALQHTGFTDGFVAEGSSGATEVTFRGRDALAPLHDAYVEHEKSYQDSTYRALVSDALQSVGIDSKTLKTSNFADRKIRAGIPIAELAPPRVVDVISLEIEPGVTSPSVSTVEGTIQCKLRERWIDFVRRYIDRAGLMLWAGADGAPVLSAPNAAQKAAYRLLRKRKQSASTVNVEEASYSYETTHRHSEVVIYGRSGGKKFGRVKHRGAFQDAEMLALGYHRPIVLRDTEALNNAQAAFLARRRIAEERRGGFQLTYRVTGHTTAALQTGERAVWTPDTVVEVDDDEFGLHGDYYIESVEYRRGPETSSTLRLMRLEDLVFGEST